jgi:hypothetical protein
LHCSVELFADPQTPTAVTKAKEAAVLFDRVIFEAGLLDVTITPSGSSTWWTPPHQLTDEKLADTRRPIPLGSDVVMAFGAQSAPGVPATEMRAFVNDKLSARYMAEFHTGILDELVLHEPDWVEVIAIGTQDPPRSTPSGKAIAELNWSDFRAPDLIADQDSFLRSFVYKSFNHDLVLAANFESTFTITRLFEPMLEHRGVDAHTTGDQALSIVVPNIGRLPWEAVGEFREHPGSGEAREMLRTFETIAAQQEPEDAYAWLKSVSQQVTDAYASALAATTKSLPEELAKEALLTGVAFIPAVGPVVEKTAAVSQTLLEVMRERKSWSAALWQLRAG